MAKEKVAKEATEATKTTETGAARLSFAEAKKVILAAVAALGEMGNFDDESGEPLGGAYIEVNAFAPFDALREYAGQIKATTLRGLPFADQIATLESELAELYANVKTENGKPVFSPEWHTDTQAKIVKIASLKARLARETKKPNDATETTEANTEENN